MELLNKYYESLKDAINYLDNIKDMYKRQKAAYEALNNRISNLNDGRDESLEECSNILKEEKSKKFWNLVLFFFIEGGLLVELVALINFIAALGIPLFIPIMMSIMLFLLSNHKGIREYDCLKKNIRTINETKVLLGEKTINASLVDLLKQLEESLNANATYIADFEKGVDEYMSLLIASENKMLPYGPVRPADDVIESLENGLKKLQLCYGDDNNGED